MEKGQRCTLSSVTFQSLIFAFGGSLAHVKYIPLTNSPAKSVSGHTRKRNDRRRQRTMMKQRPWFVPLVRSELPRLASRHHAHDSLPCVRAKFLERVGAVDDKVPLDGTRSRSVGGSSRARGGAGGGEGCGGGGGWVASSIDVQEVFGARVSGCCSAFACGRRRFKAIVWWGVSMLRAGTQDMTYTASCRNRLTLYIVINAVGEDEIMIIGNMFSVQK